MQPICDRSRLTQTTYIMPARLFHGGVYDPFRSGDYCIPRGLTELKMALSMARGGQGGPL